MFPALQGQSWVCGHSLHVSAVGKIDPQDDRDILVKAKTSDYVKWTAFGVLSCTLCCCLPDAQHRVLDSLYDFWRRLLWLLIDKQVHLSSKLLDHVHCSAVRKLLTEHCIKLLEFLQEPCQLCRTFNKVLLQHKLSIDGQAAHAVHQFAFTLFSSNWNCRSWTTYRRQFMGHWMTLRLTSQDQSTTFSSTGCHTCFNRSGSMVHCVRNGSLLLRRT